MFYSAFEELKLPAAGPMNHATTKLYVQSPTLILHVGPCDLMLGRAPLKGSLFQFGIAETAAADGSSGATCTRWLWQFGRGRPCIAGLSVSETEKKRDMVFRAGAKRSHESRPPRGSQVRTEMNETYGMSASEVISQDNSV